MELYYKNGEIVRKDRSTNGRVETVVVYLPDISSCVPTRVEWDALMTDYKRKADSILSENEFKSTGNSSHRRSSLKSSDSKSVDTVSKSKLSDDGPKHSEKTGSGETTGDNEKIEKV